VLGLLARRLPKSPTAESKDPAMAELIWLIIVMLFGFACGYAVRSYISPRRRAEERKRFAEVRRLYKISKAQ
jgi:hypothetical protein